MSRINLRPDAPKTAPATDGADWNNQKNISNAPASPDNRGMKVQSGDKISKPGKVSPGDLKISKGF